MKVRKPGFRRFLYWVVLYLLVGAGLASCFIYYGGALHNHSFTTDTPWILATGRYLLETRTLPTHDIFSWTAADKPWVLYQWLFEALVAMVNQTVGIQALLRGFIVLVAGLYFFLPYFRETRRGTPVLITLAVGALVLATIVLNITVRPMIVTSLFLAVQYLLLQRYRAEKMSLPVLLAWIAVIYALWNNAHTGVILGFGSFGLMLAGDWMERCGWYRFTPPVAEDRSQPLAIKTYLIIIATAFLASLLNPYGVMTYAYLANLSGQEYLNSVINELQSPNFHGVPLGYFTILFLLFLTVLPRVNRRMTARDLLHLLVLTFAMLFVQRFIVWTCLLYVLVLPRSLYYMLLDNTSMEGLWRHSVIHFNRYRWIAPAFLLFFAAGFLFIPKQLNFAPVQYGLCQSLLPGIDAYESVKLKGDRVLNDPLVGSCTLFRHPDRKVFIDTRFDFYGQEFLREQRTAEFLMSDWNVFLNKWHIDTLIMTRNWPMIRVLMEDDRYKTLYSDRQLVILRKK